ncbi:MAG: hypothetical protein E7580_02695 [Ruminococcaceae bacterium]|nr:hypothetical protein [Oscillospiraceae bacterium]
MFDEKEIAEYRETLPSLKAKQRILCDLQTGIRRKKTENLFLTRFLPLAACFILILGAVFLLTFARSSLILTSTPEQETDIAHASMARSIAPPTLTAKAELKLPTEISVKNGKVTVTDAETNEILGVGTNLRVHGKVVICWQLDGQPSQSGELTLSCLGIRASYRASEAGDELIRTK